MGRRPWVRAAAALALLLPILLTALGWAPAAPEQPADRVDIELFSREGCPRCAAATESDFVKLYAGS